MEKLFFNFFFSLLSAITPEVRGLLVNALLQMEERAKETASQADDMFVRLLKGLIGL